MGLLFNMSVYDLGYIRTTQDIQLSPNYTEGCRIFCDTFLKEAQARCPVRTGYLRSTISASSTASSITCIVEADYAQYVEYGTSRQSAQPYFEPALEIAFDKARKYWNEAENEVIILQRQFVDRGKKLEGKVNDFEKNKKRVRFRGTNVFSVFFMTIITGLVEALFSILREVFTGKEKKQQYSKHSNWSSTSSFISTF